MDSHCKDNVCWFPVQKNAIQYTKTHFSSNPRCEDWFSWCRLCEEELAVQLMDGHGALLPASSCTYCHLAPHFMYFLPDSLDSKPLHEGTYLSG